MPKQSISIKILGILAVIVLIGVLGYPIILSSIARSLIVEDKLEKASAIVVLGGDNNGERVFEATRLFDAGYAPILIMSGGQVAWNLTQADLMRSQALTLGVPTDAIITEPRSRSTKENATFTLAWLQEHQKELSPDAKSVIVVTSPFHTRRAKSYFQAVYSKAGYKVMITAAHNSADRWYNWWQDHDSSQNLLWEFASYLYNIL